MEVLRNTYGIHTETLRNSTSASHRSPYDYSFALA